MSNVLFEYMCFYIAVGLWVEFCLVRRCQQAGCEFPPPLQIFFAAVSHILLWPFLLRVIINDAIPLDEE